MQRNSGKSGDILFLYSVLNREEFLLVSKGFEKYSYCYIEMSHHTSTSEILLFGIVVPKNYFFQASNGFYTIVVMGLIFLWS